ncbi:hypothetical protein Z945_584 [Sulfitobacter noctilucae]|uniref:PP_RS20740 family protein n=1 Tax=Sulfitobacter noctilucae TaxID=1342302 RepID=UPI00046875DF|nr:hypothetical protein [Sulfitobacter noctilucae]KIN65540.1 hypothetical protein Z945_584 [Sulfitobacter noctilucae]
MSTEFDSPDDSFDEFALPAPVDEVATPEPLAFAPWHKPRKQYVRRYQWAHHADKLIQQLRDTGALIDGAPVRYLTLPGPDLFDVKLIADVCAEHGQTLHYTGFCYVRETEAVRLRRHTRQFEVDRAGLVHAGSSVHVSRLEDITLANSEARTLMRRSGPYDIVNIDACEPIANSHTDQTGRLVDAIRSIVEFQLGAQRRPWVLYLTTPVQIDSISPQSLDALYQQVLQNVQGDPDFAAEFGGKFVPGEPVEDFWARVSQDNGIEFIRAVTLGISKWLVHLAEQANFSVKKLPSYCYSMFRKEPFVPNMISTCYIFIPKPIEIFDQTGLTLNQTVPQGTAPLSDHIRALRRSFGIENLDTKMDSDLAVKQAMIDESKTLLTAAGYPVEDANHGYDLWLSTDPMEAREKDSVTQD